MYEIKLNSRKLLDYWMNEYIKLDSVQAHTMSKLIDRMHKIDHALFVAEADAILKPSQREDGTSERLFELLKVKSLDDLPDELKSHDSVAELNLLIAMLKKSKITNVVFDISLMRGFDYYTDIVFEVFDMDPENNRSMFGGGRYDGLVAAFGVEPVPTIGFGMGDVTLANFLDVHGLLPKLKVETELYVSLIGDVYGQSQEIIDSLRQMGLKVAVDATGRKADKQLKSAIKKGINFILFIGEKELADEQFSLKDLKTGLDERLSIQRVVSTVKDYRK